MDKFCHSLAGVERTHASSRGRRFPHVFVDCVSGGRLSSTCGDLVPRQESAEPGGGKPEVRSEPIPAPARNQADAEVVSFVALLQEKGRLVDFLMDDITAYNDAQVGAAARVVHEGCKAAFQEHFRICPVRGENEGSIVKVAAGYAADEYRLIGKIRGGSAFLRNAGPSRLEDRAVELPRVLRISADRLPTIAPAEVELR